MTPLLRAVVRLRAWKVGPARGAGQDPSRQVRSEGFLVGGQGYIVTSERAVSDARLIEVSLHDGRTFQASVVALDPLSGVAILKVPATDLPTIVLGDSRDIAVGEPVLVTGAAQAPDRAQATTVRATGRATGGNLAIDLAPRSDALGGPVLDRQGHAIGVLTGDAQAAGAGEPMSFAVPIDRVKAVLRSVPRTGVVAGPMVIER